MNIADIIKLGVSGYTKEQIKELDGMSKDTPELLDYAKSGKSFEDVKSLFDFSAELNAGAAEAPPAQEQNPDTGKSDPAADLEAKIKELEKQNSELKESIKTLQSQNTHTDQSGSGEDPMEAFGQVVASFM